MEKIFVTGATGLLGSFICKALVDNGYQVKALYREGGDFTNLGCYRDHIEWVRGDIFDISQLEKVIWDRHAVVHSAGMVSYNRSDAAALYKTNVEGTANVVNACIATGVPNILHISSIAAIGKDKNLDVVDENAKWVNSKQNTAYAKSKYMAELEVWRGFMEGLNGIILNPSVVLGPGNWHRSSARLFKYVWDENKFYVNGEINYVDVRDVADIAVNLMESDQNRERYIINAGNIAYCELFEKMGQYLNKQPPKIKVGKLGLQMGGLLEQLKSKMGGGKPNITKDFRRSVMRNTRYNNKKVRDTCQFEFRDIDNTLQWSCEQLVSLYGREQF